MAWWRGLVRRLVPAELLRQADTSRRVQLVLALILCTILGSTLRFLSLSWGGLFSQALFMSLLPLGATLVLILIRYRLISLDSAGHLLMALLMVVVTNAMVRRGGVHSRVALSAALIPLLATFISGARAGGLWLGVVLTQLLTFVAMEASGVVLVDELAESERLAVQAVGATLFCVVVFVVGLAYELTRKAAIEAAVSAELDAAKAAEEARMSRVERMAALGQLAAGVAHEVNNPLTFLTGNLEFLHKSLSEGPVGDDDREPLLEVLAEAQEGLGRIAVIVRDLKTFVREVEDPVADPCDVHQVVRSVVRLTDKQVRRRASLHERLCEGSPHVAASDAKLAQVLLNLVINALQAFDPEAVTEEGHVITLETRLEARDVIITVRDNGPGMSEEVQRRATEPFFTTKPVGVGTGLGLSVCHNLVADLGGELTIESELGRGTAIAVRLPRVQPIARTAAAPPAAIEARRLLIIDDEELVLRALRRGLVDHDVVTVSSAEEALALFETDRAFDLVLCDMMMPGRTGAELYQQVAREHPELAERFAFLTGGVYGVTEREFLESSGRPTLSKPITGDTLTELLGGPLSRK